MSLKTETNTSQNTDKNIKGAEQDNAATSGHKLTSSPLHTCWRGFKLITRLLIYIPLTLLVLVALLLGTEIGSRISVGLADKFVPGLELAYGEGTLNQDLRLSHLAWSMKGISINAQDVHLVWQPVCFLQKQLCINELTTGLLAVNVDTQALGEDSVEETPPETEPSELVLPITIILGNAVLNAIDIKVDDMRFAAKRISTQAQWLTSGLTLDTLVSDGLSVLIPSGESSAVNTTSTIANATNAIGENTKINSANPAKSEQANPEKTRGITENPQTQTTAKTTATESTTVNDSSKINDSNTDKADDTWALAALPPVFMPFPLQVDELSLHNTRLQIGERVDEVSQANLRGSFHQYQLNLTQLDIAHTDGTLSLKGDLALTQDYPLNIKADIQLNQLPELPELSGQQLSLSLGNSVGQLAIDANAKGDADFALKGEITLSDATLPYSFHLSEGRLQWPLKTPLYLVDSLALETQGNLKEQSAKLSANLVTPYHSVLAIATDVLHKNSTLIINQFDASGDIGQVGVTGELGYQDAVSWKANVLLNELKLQAITLPNDSTGSTDKAGEVANTEKTASTAPATELPTSLISGRLQTQGKLQDAHWQVALTDTQLSGKLQGYTFDINGDVSLNDALHLSSNGLNANVLGTTLTLSGAANRNWDLNAELQVPDFGLWLPDASGQLQANITVSGDEKQPKVNVVSHIANVKYQDFNILESNLSGNYQPLAAHKFDLSLTANTLTLAGQKLASVVLVANGDISAQSLTFKATGDLGVDTEINSQFDQKKSRLNADISRININTPVGEWQLDKAIHIAWDQAKAKGSISDFCLLNPNSRLCLNNEVNLGNKGQAQISYSGNPGKLLQPTLPSNMRWDGAADMLANLAWAPKSKPTADVKLAFSPGSIKLKRAKNREVTINYELFQLDAILDAKKLATNITFESKGVASWQSALDINVTPDRALSGYAAIKHIDLQPFGEFFPQLDTVQGLLTSQLKFSGNLDEPHVAGDIALTQGALSLTANPTLINKIDMGIRLGGQQADIKGRWMMGDGLARLTGSMQWPQGQFSGEMAIQGENLAVIQPPLALLDVSPDVTLRFDSKQLELKGKIAIPSGNIKIVQLAEGGVATSNDVVFTDSIAAAEVKTSPYAVIADLNIVVGNKLNIDGMGLKGNLQGTLLLQQQAFRPPLLFGDVKVKNGSYKFMGQTLKIRTGEVQFVGPTSVPNLNIEAIREIKSEDVTAGVRVTGTPMRPVVTLFSNPAKEQAEILSYIIKGSGFNNTNNEQNNSLMMGAALGLSSQVGGGGAINNIGNTATGLIEEFGFSNVQLDTNDEGRVAISGFIGENLMVKYGVGVFNPGYEMTVRYYLLSQLYLETVSGTLGQSLDIYYNFNIQ